MGMQYGESSMFPNGNIAISTFVKIDTTAEGYVLQAGAGEAIFGIAGKETHIPSITIQGTNLDDGLAGVAGGPAIKIYGIGSTKVPLRIATTVAVGDKLISDGSGYGTPSTTDKDKVGAIARQAGVANNIIEVDVIRFDAGV